MACGKKFFTKNLKLKKNSFFFSVHLVFSFYYCSIELKRQSEKSGLCSDTISPVQFFITVCHILFHFACVIFSSNNKVGSLKIDVV